MTALSTNAGQMHIPAYNSLAVRVEPVLSMGEGVVRTLGPPWDLAEHANGS